MLASVLLTTARIMAAVFLNTTLGDPLRGIFHDHEPCISE
jgi:hypothetical protein